MAIQLSFPFNDLLQRLFGRLLMEHFGIRSAKPANIATSFRDGKEIKLYVGPPFAPSRLSHPASLAGLLGLTADLTLVKNRAATACQYSSNMETY